jgi:GTPase
MEKESEFGNIEYKRKIVGIDDKKILSYASQMRYRVSQGNHIAYYYIGVNDDGSIYGIDDIDNTLLTFNLIVKNSQCYVLYYEILTSNELTYLKFKISDIKNIPEHRILVLGKKNNGKNSFIGNCLYSCTDNGNGYSKGLITNNNSSSLINYYPIEYVNNTINNYNNCDDINDIKIKSDYLIYLINVPHKYKYIDKINFDECVILYFSKDDMTIINNSYKYKTNLIYMIQNDNVDNFMLITVKI